MLGYRTIRSALITFAAAAVLLSGCAVQDTQDTTDQQQNNELKVYCFSVGKADAFLFYTDNSAVLIDTGESGDGTAIVEKCRELGIETIDNLIITHFDKDHVGGARKVIRELEVSRILQGSFVKDSDSYERYVSAAGEKNIETVTVTERMQFTLDNVSYTIDPPVSLVLDEDDQNASNNSSLITDIEMDGARMLFMGDAENDRIREYLDSSPGKAELIKMPHHGSWHKTLISLMDEVQPQYAVITSSDEEPEDEQTLELLADWNTKVLLTREAPVQIDIKDGTLSVSGASVRPVS